MVGSDFYFRRRQISVNKITILTHLNITGKKSSMKLIPEQILVLMQRLEPGFPTY